ncbi:MAG: hypothetical protein NTZ17_07310 [Phycisphaerae bacterium]|nr:hypothetical protein [Phycisphaerae bacterium]
MNKMNHPHVIVPVIVMSLLGGVLLVGGCQSSGRSAAVRLPHSPRLVGGGMMIEWRTPERGTVYLIEERTGKIIETRSLEEGEVYSFTATSVVQADELEQMLGIKFSRAHFQLYFEPAGEEGSAGESPETTESVHTWSRS